MIGLNDIGRYPSIPAQEVSNILDHSRGYFRFAH